VQVEQFDGADPLLAQQPELLASGGEDGGGLTCRLVHIVSLIAGLDPAIQCSFRQPPGCAGQARA
jgi:hypothetical protein